MCGMSVPFYPTFVLCPQRLGIAQNGVTGDCKLLCGCWELNPVLSTAEPPLQAPAI